MIYGAKGGSLATTGLVVSWLVGWGVVLTVIGILLMIMTTQGVAQRRRRKALGILG